MVVQVKESLDLLSKTYKWFGKYIRSQGEDYELSVCIS